MRFTPSIVIHTRSLLKRKLEFMRTKFIALFLVLSLLPIFTSTSSTQAQGTRQAVVTVDELNVRAEPHVGAEILGLLYGGTTVALADHESVRNESGVWVYVIHTNLQGWVLSTFLSFTLNDLQVNIEVTVAYNGVNVRDDPDTNATIIGQLSIGTNVVVHSREDFQGNGGIWVYASVDGLTGWILSSYLTFPPGNYAEHLPISYDAVGSNAEVIAQVRSFKFTTTIRIYAEPRLDAPILTEVPAGELLEIHGVESRFNNDFYGWLYVTWPDGNVFGWIDDGFLRYSGKESAVPCLPSETSPHVVEEPIQVQGFLTTGEWITSYHRYTIRLRLEPNIESLLIAELPYQTLLGVYGRTETDAGTWYFVKMVYGQLSGWMKYVSFPQRFDRSSLPVLPPTANPELPPSLEPIDSLLATTNTETVIRLAPGNCFSISQIASAETLVTLIGRNLSNSYFKALLNGQEGWLRYDTLTIDGNVNRLPIYYLN